MHNIQSKWIVKWPAHRSLPARGISAAQTEDIRRVDCRKHLVRELEENLVTYSACYVVLLAKNDHNKCFDLKSSNQLGGVVLCNQQVDLLHILAFLAGGVVTNSCCGLSYWYESKRHSTRGFPSVKPELARMPPLESESYKVGCWNVKSFVFLFWIQLHLSFRIRPSRLKYHKLLTLTIIVDR